MPGDSTHVEPIKTQKADYPPKAERERLQGEVRVKVVISQAGDVEKVEVLNGDPILAEAAVDAVKKWKFKPFIRGGKAVKVSTEIPFNFAFTDKGKDPAPPPMPGDSTYVEPIKTQKADYPLKAQQERLQGEVRVKVLISEAGGVDSVEVLYGDPIFAEAAVDAAKKWKFKPFIRGGKPVKISTEIPFDFAFTDKVKDTVPPLIPIGTGSQNTTKVKIASGISSGLLIHRVTPIYPQSARWNHVQGRVTLRATISKDGLIENLTLISGPKDLIPAAVGAVQQWRYKPYLLEGKPVEVETQIEVNFTLSGG